LSRVTTLTLGGPPHGREQQLTLAGQLTTYQPLNVGNRDGDDVGGMGTGQPLDVAWILAVAASSTDAPLGPPAIIAAFSAANAAATATTRTNASMTNTGEAPRWRPMEATSATKLGRHSTRSKAEKQMQQTNVATHGAHGTKMQASEANGKRNTSPPPTNSEVTQI